MKTLSLSVSRPRNANGSWPRIMLMPSTTRVCSRTTSAAHSVQPLWMSVRVRVWTKLPACLTPPQCSTRSASQYPGGGSPQSAKVRTGTLCLMAEPIPQRRRRPRPVASRTGRNNRSILAALTSSSELLTTGSSRRCPCRSMLSISTGSRALSRFPQQRQCLAHRLIIYALARSRGPRDERPVQHPQRVLAVIAGHPREFVQKLAALPSARCPVGVAQSPLSILCVSPCSVASPSLGPPFSPAADG